jgi:transposase
MGYFRPWRSSGERPTCPQRHLPGPAIRGALARFANRIKQYRRVATRYDRLAANYLAFVQLASIRLWLRRLNESAS